MARLGQGACLGLVLAGCGDKETALVPTEGSWLYSEVVYTADDCGLEGSLIYIDLIIDQVTADGFRYIDTNGDALTCSLSIGGEFACAPLEKVADYTSNGTDAVLTFTLSAAGSFSSETALSRSVEVTGECSGSECDLFGSVSFPCTTAVEMAAAYDQPAGELDTAFGG